MEAGAPVDATTGGQDRWSSGSRGGWTTVGTSRKQRHRRKAAAGLAASLPLLAAAADGDDSSAGSATPVGSDSHEPLSRSYPSPPRSTSLPPGLLAQAVERASSLDLTPAQSPRNPAPFQHQSAANGATAPGSATGRTAGTPVPPSPRASAAAHRSAGGLGRPGEAAGERVEGLLGRQDSLSHSALDLHDLAAKAALRSSKSDVAALTVSTARRHEPDRGAAALEGIPEAPRGGASAAGSSGTAAPGAGAPLAAPPLRRAAAAQAPGQPFAAYLAAELRPGPSYPTADVVWGQTERDRVYNALVAVPYQLERFLLFGVAVCLDSFLAIFTLLPLRVGLALLALARSALSPTRSSGSSAAAAAPSASVPGAAAVSPAAGAAAAGGSPTAARDACPKRRVALRGDQLFDLLSAAMSLGVVLFLWNLNAGTLYFWMKDLTQELLKLSVLYTALELSDKICCSFGVDVLEALAASCTQLAAGWGRRAAYNVACDTLVASLLLALHGATLMSQAMVFGVAMNSKKNTLVALLIAANFTEIKGTVLKRFDATKLYTLACQDVVERFHLLLVLAFVVVEEMGNSGSRSPNPVLLAGCVRIYAGEVVIDVIKHAVLGKFNEIRPGVYREYMRDLCDRVAGAQSHNIHKAVGFEPFAPAALSFRIALTAAALRHEGGLAALRPAHLSTAAPAALAVWAGLLLAKLGLGYLLKAGAAAYVAHYDAARASRGAAARRAAAASAAAGQQAKKDD